MSTAIDKEALIEFIIQHIETHSTADDVEEAVQAFRRMPIREFNLKVPVAMGALVEAKGERFFLGPNHDGMEVDYNGLRFTILSNKSPMGRTLLGKTVGQVGIQKVE